eukprot:XP_017449912.1 PREDICTED: uncharacterized protein LOC108348366 isoform X1 [Rattus norvegicus]
MSSELEELKFEIQKCKFERHELYQILDLYIYDDWDYSIRHSQLLCEQTQLKNHIQILLNENRELLVEQSELPASYLEAKGFCEESRMNICVHSAKQQQAFARFSVQCQCWRRQMEVPLRSEKKGGTTYGTSLEHGRHRRRDGLG